MAFNSADTAAFKNVWVFCEQRQGVMMPTTFELISEGRKLANELGVELCGILLGDNVKGIAAELGQYGADKVYVYDSPLLKDFTTDAYTKVIVEAVEELKPEVLLFGASNIGRDLAPRCAARLHTGLCADCTHLDIDMPNYKGFLKEASTLPEERIEKLGTVMINKEPHDVSRDLKMTRPAFGGHLMASIICPRFRPAMATVRPGVMKKRECPKNVEIIEPKFELTAADIHTEVVDTVKAAKKLVDLIGADFIVSVGRGISKDVEGGIKLAAVMTFSLAACGGTSTGSDAGTDSGADSGNDSYKIALIQQHQTNAFQIAVSEAAEAKADELGVDLTILSADQDAATQISQIEQCVSEGYDAILFEPVDPDGLADAAKSAADSGVVMINIISACTDWQNNGISAVSYGNNVKAGETEMEQVAKLLNGKGNIAILTGPSGDAGGLQRMEGYENILKNYPEIKQVVAPADCQWDTASAQSTVESWLSAYDLDAIVCENDGMAVGAGNAAGANSGIVIAGVDGTPDGFEAIQDGRITGTVSQNGGAMAANGIEAAVKLLKGETLDTTEIVTDNTWIDSSNVKDYE